ncbi:MAG: hypothetical protein JOZ99_05160, partial [Actinobacteria bacterium]|nr:hypothetical protein [Actinomycetota bacterium]
RRAAPVDIGSRRPADGLDDVLWGYESAELASCGFVYRVRTTNPAVGTYVRRLLAGSASVGAVAPRWLSLHDRVRREPRFAGYLDNDLLVATHDPSIALSAILSTIDRGTVASIVDQRLVLHAAAASEASGAVLLLGRSGAGKTTLVAALVSAGLGYVADEVVSFGYMETTPAPYHKALSLKRASRWLFPELRSTLVQHGDDNPGQVWHVPAEALRANANRSGAPIAAIVEARYHATADTTLAPLSEPDALTRILANCFSGDHLSAEAFASASTLAASAPAYRLDFSDVWAACDLVRGALSPTIRAR